MVSINNDTKRSSKKFSSKLVDIDDDFETRDAREMESEGSHHITAAYRQFAHRIENRYKLCGSPEDKTTAEIEQMMNMIPGNTTQVGLDKKRFLAATAWIGVGIPYWLYYRKSTKFRVPNNHFALVEDRNGPKPETKIYGPGVFASDIPYFPPPSELSVTQAIIGWACTITMS